MLPNVTGLRAFLWADLGDPFYLDAYTSNGTAPLTKSAPNMTLTDGVGPTPNSVLIGTQLQITQATTPANNGVYDITAIPTSTQIRYTNAAGVAEAYTGAYTTYGHVVLQTDLAGIDTYQATASGGVTRGFARVVNLVANKTVYGAHGNASYLLGSTNGVAGLPFAGDVDTSISVRAYVGAYGKQILSIDDGNPAPGSASDRIQVILSAANTTTLTRKNAGGTTTLTYASTGVTLNTWTTLGWRYTASTRVLSFFRDGALIGSSTAGTARNLPGLNRILLGNYSVNSATNYYRGFAVGAAAWTTQEFAEVHAKFLQLAA